MLERVHQLLGSRTTRGVLALLIVVSVLPHPALEDQLRPLFLLVFGLELLLRCVVLTQGVGYRPAETDSWLDQEHPYDGDMERREPDPERRSPHISELVFLGVDLVSFLTFLPLDRWLGLGHGALVALRLVRLLVLLRFVRSVLYDLYSILIRRERLQQFGLITGLVTLFSFVAAVVLHQLAVPYDYNDDPQHPDEFLDLMWWAFRQLESPDNLVPSLHQDPLLILLSLLLTVTGVFVISFVIGLGSNVVEQLFLAERRKPIRWEGHSLVVGPVQHAEVLVREFVRIYNKHRALQYIRPRALMEWLVQGGPPPRRHALPRMALLGLEEEAPNYLADPLLRWVHYRQGQATDPEALQRVSAARVRRVILLAQRDKGRDTDGVTLVSLASLRQRNPLAHIFVEVIDSPNAPLVRQVGGRGTFPLDVPRFLGLFLCQHLLVPGVESLYRDLLSSGGSEFYTHVFVDAADSKVLRAFPVGASLSWEQLSRWAHQVHGVVLTGVFLSATVPQMSASDPVPVDDVVRWLNPTHLPSPPEPVLMLGGAPGRIPLHTLSGLVGVAESYVPLQRLTRTLIRSLKRQPTQWLSPMPEALSLVDTAPRWAAGAGFKLDDGGLKQVLVVGFSPALPFFLRELLHFSPGVEILLALNADGLSREEMGERIELLNLGIGRHEPLPGELGRQQTLGSAGKLWLFTTDRPGLADFALKCLRTYGAVDAVVFLSEPEAIDRDARTALRLMRFARGLEQGHAPRGERLHVVAEFMSLAQGRTVQQYVRRGQCGYDEASKLRLTLVSTELIRNYFMVHSAFVPGVTALYEELLSEEGQELVRLLPNWDVLKIESPRLNFWGWWQLCQQVAAIPIALEMSNGRVVLNPTSQETFAPDEVRAVFALADGAHRLRWESTRSPAS
ncbi:MAG: hypothetical protein ACKO6N_26225 [Myxococcota bacterium]